MVSPNTACHTKLLGDTGRGCVGGSLCCSHTTYVCKNKLYISLSCGDVTDKTLWYPLTLPISCSNLAAHCLWLVCGSLCAESVNA